MEGHLKLFSHCIGFVLGFFIMFSAEAESERGVSHLLMQLSEMHGDYRVSGHMLDGVACEVTVHSSPEEFRFTFNDDLREDEPLEVLTLVQAQRMVFFDLRDRPKRTLLKLRDRVAYKGLAPREVDVSLAIEEMDDGRRVHVVYEDKIKRRRYVCSGPKLPGLSPDIYESLRRGQALSPGRSMYEYE